MAKRTKKLKPKDQAWVDARRRFHLSHAHIQMARELGMNPKKFGGLANHKQEPWKVPLPDFIEGLYFKSFSKTRPDQVRSIEQMVADNERKRAARKARKQAERERQAVEASAPEDRSGVPFQRSPDDKLQSSADVHSAVALSDLSRRMVASRGQLDTTPGGRNTFRVASAATSSVACRRIPGRGGQGRPRQKKAAREPPSLESYRLDRAAKCQAPANQVR